MEQSRSRIDDVSFEFSNKMIEIFEDNIGLRKTVPLRGRGLPL